MWKNCGLLPIPIGKTILTEVRPPLFRFRLLYILLTFFPFIKLDAVTVRVISDFSLITSVGVLSAVTG